MAKARYKPFPQAQEEIRRSGPVQSLVHEHAERIASAAGDGFRASYMQGKSRYRAIVYADTWSAKHREARDNVLVRVLG